MNIHNRARESALGIFIQDSIFSSVNIQDYDESLEVRIAAGFDVPTAMALSEHDDKPSKGCGQAAAIILIAAAAVWELLRLL